MEGAVAEIRDARFRKRVRSGRAEGEYAPSLSYQALMRMYLLSERDARIVSDTVPLRGTNEWREREIIRRSIGNRCLSLTRLPGDAPRVGR